MPTKDKKRKSKGKSKSSAPAPTPQAFPPELVQLMQQFMQSQGAQKQQQLDFFANHGNNLQHVRRDGFGDVQNVANPFKVGSGTNPDEAFFRTPEQRRARELDQESARSYNIPTSAPRPQQQGQVPQPQVSAPQPDPVQAYMDAMNQDPQYAGMMDSAGRVQDLAQARGQYAQAGQDYHNAAQSNIGAQQRVGNAMENDIAQGQQQVGVMNDMVQSAQDIYGPMMDPNLMQQAIAAQEQAGANPVYGMQNPSGMELDTFNMDLGRAADAMAALGLGPGGNVASAQQMAQPGVRSGEAVAALPGQISGAIDGGIANVDNFLTGVGAYAGDGLNYMQQAGGNFFDTLMNGSPKPQQTYNIPR